jgi:hypothetical protein
MRAKKLLKIGGITLLSAVVLLLLFVVAFVFNPFEGTLPNMRDVVPRNVDVFLRKERLAEDFAEFPEPLFWQELNESRGFRDVQRTPLYRQWSAEVTRTARELRQMTDQLKDAWLLPEDLIGTEAIVAARLKSAQFADTTWCVYLRVSWKVRAAWGLAGYAFVQEQLRRNGLVLRSDGELYEVRQQEQPQALYAARYRDCLVVGNDRQIVTESYDLAKGPLAQQEGFGNSGFYQTGIKERVEEWQKLRNVDDANALEVFANTDAMLQRTTWDDHWPDENASQDMNQRVLARFVNLKGWKYLAGALVFEGDSLTALGRVDLNRNLHTPFQAGFFKAEQQPRATWLDPFLRMVPMNACAAAGMRMPAGDFLREMFRSLERADQSNIEDGLKRTGQFTSFEDLVNKLEPALEPRTGFVFRKNAPDKDIPVADPTVVPQVAWVFWLKDAQRKLVEDFLNLMLKHHQVLGFTKAWQLPIKLSGQAAATIGNALGDVVYEFTNPQIPGTGEIAAIVFDRFLILGNSGPLISDLIRARHGATRSIGELNGFKEFSRELPGTVNGFVWLHGQAVEEMLREYDQELVQGGGEPDPEWMGEKRPGVELDVFAQHRAEFAPARVPKDVTGPAKERFEELVRQRLREVWQREGSAVTAASRENVQQLLALVRQLSSAYLHVELDETSLRFGGRVKLRFRQQP